MSMDDAIVPLAGPGMGATGAVAGAAADAGARAREAQTAVLELTADVDRLFNVVNVLWQILKEDHGYDDETLRRRVADVERARLARDDASDAPRPCIACGRQVSRRRSRCMYCNAVNAADPFAR